MPRRRASDPAVVTPWPVRAAALAGVVGPTAFVGAWAVSAALTSEDYSSVHDAISRLAAIGADSRPLMTAGFVTFGLALPVYGWALRRSVQGPSWVAATAAGLATLAVAATPLGRSDAGDRWHGLFAGLGYVALAATPLLAARPLAHDGHAVLARFAVAAATVSAVALALTLSSLPTGLFQRLGLTVSDIWIAASGLAIARGRWRSIAGATR